MAFYLIGIGMNLKSISAEALEVLKKCNKIYLENYTVNFPYSISDLSNELDLEVEELGRGKVEDESIINESDSGNVALLVYGDCLSATTHMQLILAAKEKNIDYKIFHNSSIMTVVAETGLQLYKFGKTASMPNWAEHTNKPTSFMNYVKENNGIGAHTLILTDIGLGLKESIEQLREAGTTRGVPLGRGKKIVVISNAGTEKQKIFYGELDELECKNIEMPFCMIVPSEMHFIEEESLNSFKEN